MTEYLIAFNGEWVPEHTLEELQAKSRALRPLIAEMKAAGVLIFTGGLDDSAPVFSVDASSGMPLFTDGPFIESKEYLAGYYLLDCESRDRAIELAALLPEAAFGALEVRPLMNR